MSVLRCYAVSRFTVRGRLLVVAARDQRVGLSTNHRLRCRRVGDVPRQLAAVREPGALPGNHRRGTTSPGRALRSAALSQRARLRSDLGPRRDGAGRADRPAALLRPRRMRADRRLVYASARCRLLAAETAERARLPQGHRRRGVLVGAAVRSTAPTQRVGLSGGRSCSVANRTTLLSSVRHRT